MTLVFGMGGVRAVRWAAASAEHGRRLLCATTTVALAGVWAPRPACMQRWQYVAPDGQSVHGLGVHGGPSVCRPRWADGQRKGACSGPLGAEKMHPTAISLAFSNGRQGLGGATSRAVTRRSHQTAVAAKPRSLARNIQRCDATFFTCSMAGSPRPSCRQDTSSAAVVCSAKKIRRKRGLGTLPPGSWHGSCLCSRRRGWPIPHGKVPPKPAATAPPPKSPPHAAPTHATSTPQARRRPPPCPPAWPPPAPCACTTPTAPPAPH